MKKPPMSTRDHVEALHRIAAAAARPPLQPAPRPDALLVIPSFAPTEDTSTIAHLARALWARDTEALTTELEERLARIENPRTPVAALTHRSNENVG